ncbi:MAG TPA: metallophosphoesterase [Solirubrobacteraceae bacterium]
MRRITRRRALAEALRGSAALPLAAALPLSAGLAACDLTATSTPTSENDSKNQSHFGSTVRGTWGDPVGDGQLRPGPGEPLVHRTELGRRAALGHPLASLAHVTDAHVLDASSPARVTFLDRLGPPFQSTFRPQEALTAQVLAGTVAAIRALRPQAVIQGGDLIDNAQSNELAHALAILRGGRVQPGSGRDGYFGVQLASDSDPFYYRPDVDSPRHPGLLRRASRPFTSPGVTGRPVLPVLGDHDALVAGELVPSELTRSLAVGSRALWDLPAGLSLPPGARSDLLASPDGPPAPALVDELLTKALEGPTVGVPADPSRRQLQFAEVQSRLSALAPATVPRTAERLDYAIEVGPQVRVIVLDLVRRGGGSGGQVVGGQAAWLASELARSGRRWVVVVSHQPLDSSAGGEPLLALLDRAPRVVAVLSGHTHRNQIRARATSAGGYWLISTASLIDFPQQARAVRIVATTGGGVAIQTWMLDHVSGGDLGSIARQLSYLDAQGGRPRGFAGSPADRNAILYRRPSRS